MALTKLGKTGTTIDQLHALALEHGYGKTGKILGIAGDNVRARLVRAGRGLTEAEMQASYQRNKAGYIPEEKSDITFTPIPDDDVPIDELVRQRQLKFQHKREHEEASKLITIKVRCEGPIGIWHCGDPHVDDDGTDIISLQTHMDIVRRTAGLYAANVGDTTNNWVGRLARLYAQQSTSAKQAWRLAEWFVKYLRGYWLYTIGGNHDVWSGDGDPLIWITKQEGALYQSTEARLKIVTPDVTFRINARHDFRGNSQYNSAHGVTKAFIFGTRDHLSTCGHKHVSGYNMMKDPDNGTIGHGVQVASYKIYDRYAKEQGFRDQTFSPCAVTVINTELTETHPDFIKVFWQPEEGADYLAHLRKKGGYEVKRK